MRIVQKFQEGKQVNRQPRHFVGHPYLAYGEPELTYNILNSAFNQMDNNYAKHIRRDNSEEKIEDVSLYGPGVDDSYIRRHIRYGNEWAPNDTIYTQIVNGRDQSGYPNQLVTGQAGVIHTNNYDSSSTYWPLRSWAAPKIINGKVQYYNFDSNNYQ